MKKLLQQYCQRYGAAVAFGALAFALSACSPQNATRATALFRNSASAAQAAAVDVQKNNGARHFVVRECVSSACSLVFWRKDSLADRNVVVATEAVSRDFENVDIAAMNDGSAVLVWLERDGATRTPKYAIVPDSGAVSGPFNLGLAGHEYTEIGVGRSPLKVASNGTTAYAVYISGASNTHRLWYRQILPVAPNPALIQDVATLGPEGYISAPVVKVDPAGNAHVAWRYVKIAGYSAVGYARVTAPGGSPPVIEVERSGTGSGITLSEAGLVLDTAFATPRAHVAYNRLSGSIQAGLVVARYDDAVFQTTRVITLTGADGWTVAGGVDAPSVAMNVNTPVVAFSARRAPADVGFYAYLWKGSGLPQRVSAVGGLFAKDIRAVNMGVTTQAALVAYKVVSTTLGASGVFVFDSVFSRTVTVATDPICNFGYCQENFDVAASGDTLAGVWLAKKAGDANFRAYEARNDNTPQGYLPVTSLADANLSDSVLTLREAMLVANGTLTTSFSTVERGLLENGGCIFNGSGAIIGGCGRGITDTVVITPGLAGTITLSALLPPINDTQPTLLNGPEDIAGESFGSVAIDGRNLMPSAPLETIFDVVSSDNRVTGWTLLNAQRGVRVTGNHNLLGFLKVYSHSVAGLEIDGGDNNFLGFIFSNTPSSLESCASGRNGVGMIMHSGAQSNTVGTSLLSCASEYGLILDGAATSHNSFSNIYAGGIAGVLQGNLLGGVLIRNGANNNKLEGGNVFGNSGPGMTLRDSGQNLIGDMSVMSNTGPGVLIEGTSANNTLSGTVLMSNTTGIRHAGGGANFWTRLSVFANSGLGIDTGAAGVVDAPSITFTSYNPASGQISGTLTFAGPSIPAQIELYAAEADPTGYGEGREWLGAVATASDAVWTMTVPAGHTCVTAVVHRANGSSEFSQVFCRYASLLPLTLR